MPLTQLRRDNPAMSLTREDRPVPAAWRREDLFLHSQLYMARERNVGTKNAEKTPLDRRD